MVGVQYAGVAFVPFLVAAIAAVLRKWRLVIAALLVYPLKLLVEKVVLKEIVYRARPGTNEPDAVLRHVPAHGPSFPSGHAIVAFALAGIVAPYLTRGWRIVAYVAALAVAFSRIYLGAHNPLDVLAGAAAGLLLASVLNLVLLPAPQPRAGPRRCRPCRPTDRTGVEPEFTRSPSRCEGRAARLSAPSPRSREPTVRLTPRVLRAQRSAACAANAARVVTATSSAASSPSATTVRTGGLPSCSTAVPAATPPVRRSCAGSGSCSTRTDT